MDDMVATGMIFHLNLCLLTYLNLGSILLGNLNGMVQLELTQECEQDDIMCFGLMLGH